jgi:hypothetical protein
MIVTTISTVLSTEPQLISGDWQYEPINENEAEIIKYLGSDENVIIPAAIDGYIVSSLHQNAFFYYRTANSITIPDSITEIKDDTFQFCYGLTSVKLPDSLISIGAGAFGFSGLTTVTIPAKVTDIGDDTFQWCASLVSVTFKSETPPNLGRNVFYNDNIPWEYRKLTTIYVPVGAKATYENIYPFNIYDIVEFIICGDCSENENYCDCIPCTVCSALNCKIIHSYCDICQHYNCRIIHTAPSETGEIVLKWTDNISVRYTENRYEFSLPASGLLTVKFEHRRINDSKPYWNITLFSYGSELFFIQSKGNVSTLNYHFGYLPAGTYSIKVTDSSEFEGGGYNSMDYTLTAYFETGIPCNKCNTISCIFHYQKGDVNGDGIINMDDAVQVLLFHSKLPSVITDKNSMSWKASLITPESIDKNQPGLGDAVQILMKTAKLPCMI